MSRLACICDGRGWVGPTHSEGAWPVPCQLCGGRRDGVSVSGLAFVIGEHTTTVQRVLAMRSSARVSRRVFRRLLTLFDRLAKCPAHARALKENACTSK